MDDSPGSDAMEWQLDTSPVILHQAPEPFHTSSSSRRRSFDDFSDGSEPMTREPAMQHVAPEETPLPQAPQHLNRRRLLWLTLCIWHLITAAVTKTSHMVVSYKRRRSSPPAAQRLARRSPPRSRIFRQNAPTVQGHASITPITPRNLRLKPGITNAREHDHLRSVDVRNFEVDREYLMSGALQSEPTETSITTPDPPIDSSPRSLRVRLMPGTYPESPIQRTDQTSSKQSSPLVEPITNIQTEQVSPSPQSTPKAELEDTLLPAERSPPRQFGDPFEDYEALIAINLKAYEQHRRRFGRDFKNPFLRELATIRTSTGFYSGRSPLSSLPSGITKRPRSSTLATPPRSILRSGRYGLATPVQRQSLVQGISSFPRRVRTALGRREDPPTPEMVGTPSRLRRSVVFAESPRTGRPVTATKRFYKGERIDHPSPGSSLDENSILSSPSVLASNTQAFGQNSPILEESPRISMSEDQAATAQLNRELYQSFQSPNQQATIADPSYLREPISLHSPQHFATISNTDKSAGIVSHSSQASANVDGPPMPMADASDASQPNNHSGSFSSHEEAEVTSLPSLGSQDTIANADTLQSHHSIPASPTHRLIAEPVNSSNNSSPHNGSDSSSPEQQKAKTSFKSSLSSFSPPLLNDQESVSEVDNSLSLSAQLESDHGSSFDTTESSRRFLPTSSERESSFELLNNSSSLFSQPDVKEGCSLDHSSEKLSQQSLKLKQEGDDDVFVEKIDDGLTDQVAKPKVQSPSPDLPAAVAGLMISPPRGDLETSGRRSSERRKRISEYKAQEQARLAKETAEAEAQLKKEANEQALRDGVRRKPKAKLILPLTPEADQLVTEALKKGPNAQVALTSTGNPITRRDIGKVLPQRGTGDDPSGWLNDEIVVAYLQMVTDCAHERAGHKRNEIPKFHSFNPFFYTNLKKKGYEGVKRWANKAKIGGKNLEKVERIFIPVNEAGNHWTMAIVSPTRKTIEYFDSMHHESASVVKNVKAWLKAELGSAYKEAEWNVREQPGFEGVGGGPTQDNARDCGVFAVTTAKMVALNVDPMTVSAADMPLQRRRIVAEMLNGGFSGAFEPIVEFD